MRALAPHWQLLSAPWRQRYTEKAYGFVLTLAVLLLAVAAVLAYLRADDERAVRHALCGAGVAFLIVLWLLQLVAFKRFNHPSHARLVPTQLQRLRESLLACWLLGALAGAGILGWGFGHAVQWFLALAMSLVFVASALTWPLLGLIVCAWPVWWDQGGADLVRQTIVPLYQEWPFLCSGLLLLAGARFLTHRFLRSGDAWHVSDFERLHRVRFAGSSLAQQGQVQWHHWGPWGTRIRQVFLFPWHRYMQYRVRHPHMNPANVMARAELVLRADGHWVLQASMAAWLAAIVAVVYGVASWHGGPQGLQKTDQGWLGLVWWCLLLISITPVLGLYGALYRTRREQALLMLVPGMPQGMALNRVFTLRLLRQAGLGWLLAAGLAFQLPFKQGTPDLVLVLFGGLLPASALLVQDWSRLQALRPQRALANSLLVLAGPALCLIALQVGQIERAWVLLACVLLAAGLLRWRWSRLEQFAPAFPVGRRAGLGPPG